MQCGSNSDNYTSEFNENSIEQYETSTESVKINYKNEIVFLFFNSMFNSIVDTYEPDVFECVSSIPSGTTIITSKPYKQITEEDLTDVTECIIEGSSISLHKSDDLKQNTSLDLSTSSIKRPGKSYKKSKSANDENKSIRNSFNDKIFKRNSSTKKKLLSVTEKDDTTKDSFTSSHDTSWMIESVDETVTIKFKNGNTYQGPVFRKLMHGFGTFKWHDGTQYAGEFKNGELTGKGRMTYPDSSWYEGEFLNGFRHGFGTMVIGRVTSIYSGHWKIGKKHGDGWMLFSPENWYEGEWRNDYMDSFGLRQYQSSARYHGKWKDGCRDGFGCAVLRNNDFYSGDWSKGIRKGFGEYTWNCFHNKTFTFPVQNKFTGSWDNNMMHGIGVMNFGMSGGVRYTGCYNNNEKHGAGVLICENGVVVQSNPLFINDKPVHLTSSGSLVCLPEEESDESEMTELKTITSIKSATTSGSKIHVSSFINPSVPILPKRKRSSYRLKHYSVPNTKFDKATLANLSLCKLRFGTYQENYLSLPLAINTPSELINLSFYIDEVLKKLTTNFESKCFYSEFSKDSSPYKMSPIKNTYETSENSSPTTQKLKLSDEISYDKDYCLNSETRELMLNEEKWLRNAITLHLPKLRLIYQYYSSLPSLKKLPFETLLIKLFLWQFYRDCKIPEKGISLIQTDDILAENIEMENRYNPFEIIYFWQFLHSLIGIAWKIYGHECVGYVDDGILKTVFNKFLENDVFPNYGHHTGSALFDYIDLLPIQNVYEWYQSYGEPHTVLQFLRNSCTIKNEPPSISHAPENCKTPPIPNGINSVAAGHKLIYLQDEPPELHTKPEISDVKVNNEDSFPSKLFFLRKLGAKHIISCVKQFCPAITIDDEIVNLQHPLTFLEFYEIVLMCAQNFIDEEKQRIEIEKQEEELRKTVTDSLSFSAELRKKSKTKRYNDKRRKYHG